MDENEVHQDGASETGAALLPAVPESLGVEPLLLALLSAMAGLSATRVSETDLASRALEDLGLYVQRLPDARLDEVQASLDAIVAYGKTAGWSEQALDFVRQFMLSCGIAEGEEPDEH